MNTTETQFEITEPLVRKLLATVDAGLTNGLGEPIPGKMCVEAAISYALGEPHGDGPSCVEPCVRAGKIALNDSRWSSNEARAKGMRAVAIAQLGSRGVVGPIRYTARLAELTIRQIVPISLRAAASVIPAHYTNLHAAALQCEEDGTANAAYAAANVAKAAATDAAYSADKRDDIFSLMASLMVQVLRECGSPGCEWLWLVKESAMGLPGGVEFQESDISTN